MIRPNRPVSLSPPIRGKFDNWHESCYNRSPDMIQEPLLTLSDPPDDGPAIVPMPATSPFRQSSILTPVVCDERAIGRLLETILHRSGMSIEEAARRLGVTSNSIRQYLAGRRRKPSLLWFVRLANLCGSSVEVRFPTK